MAYVTPIRAPRLDVLSALRGAVQNGVEAWARYRMYRTTLEELQELSNRELADMGLNRGLLRGLAYEAAYGQK